MRTGRVLGVEDLVGRKGDTKTGADDELAPFQCSPGGGAWPLPPESRWKAGPFLEDQEEVPKSPKLTLQPVLGCPSGKQKTESNTALPQLSSLLPAEHFPGAPAEGSPSSLCPLPPLTCQGSWRQEGTHRAWRDFSRTKARRHQGMYF